MEEVRLKETYYNSDWNMDIDFLKFFFEFFFNELPPLIGLERLQLCMETGLVWFKLQDYMLHILIIDKVRFG